MTSYLANGRLDPGEIARLGAIQGLSPLVSDVLDDLMCDSVVPGTQLHRRTPVGVPTVVGHSMTLSYSHVNRQKTTDVTDLSVGGLAHADAFLQAHEGDVIVIDARGEERFSVLGGRGAALALQQKIAGLVVDGAVRDVEDIGDSGLEVWSTAVTPRTGRRWFGNAHIGGSISCCGILVSPGDLFVGDSSGVCFVPKDLIADVVPAVWRMVELEEKDKP